MIVNFSNEFLRALTAVVAVAAIVTLFAVTIQVLTVAVRQRDVIAHTAWRRAEVHDALAATAAVVVCAYVNCANTERTYF